MAKDNQTEKVFRIIGASNHSATDREAVDFYSTDPDCVKDLLKVEEFGDVILEPCCGSGNISKALEEEGKVVISTDLYDHGYGVAGVDFFTEYTKISNSVITNPPFGLVNDFIEHALDAMLPGTKMALFLKLQFLEGQDRYAKVFSKKHLKTVYIYSKRVACYKGNQMYQTNEDGSFKLDKQGNRIKIASAVAYAWYVFEKDYVGDPTIKWINN